MKFTMFMTALIFLGCSLNQSPVQTSPKMNYKSTDNSQNPTTNNYYNWNPEELRSELKKRDAVLIKQDSAIKWLQDSLNTSKDAVANLSIKLIGLEKKVQPRIISAEQRRLLIGLLRTNPPQDSIGVSSPLGSGEAANYASQIASILKMAGWNVDEGMGRSIITGTGISLIVPNKDNLNASRLQYTFAQASIPLRAEVIPSMSRVQIFVGDK